MALKYNRLASKKPQVIVVEDSEFNIEDIKKDADVLELEIIDIEPKSFVQAISKAIFDLPDGVLIDIDLSDLELDDINLGSNKIKDGIDIASYLFDFNSNIPIGVYSANLEYYEFRLKELNENIFVLKKDYRSFEDILRQFKERVHEVKIYREAQKNLYSFSYFEKLSLRSQYRLLVNRIDSITVTHYFRAVGDYAWFIAGEFIIRDLHGPLIPDSEPLIKDQLNLLDHNEFEITDELDLKKLEQIWKESDYLPIPFFNFRNYHCLRATKDVYAKELLKLKDNIWGFIFGYQLAKKIFSGMQGISESERYQIFENLNESAVQFARPGSKLEIAENHLINSSTDNEGKKSYVSEYPLKESGHFQKQLQLLWKHRHQIPHADKIPDFLADLDLTFDEQITDIYKGEIEKVITEDGQPKKAQVLFENIFKDNVKERKNFKYDRLASAGVTARGDRFLYVFFENKNKHSKTRYIQLLEYF